MICLPNNYTLFLLSADVQRQELDRRWLEDAHMKYACLQLLAWFPEAVGETCTAFQADMIDTLAKITPALFFAFEAKYAGVCYPVATTTMYLTRFKCNDCDVILKGTVLWAYLG